MRRFPRQIIYFSILANIMLWVGISIALFATRKDSRQLPFAVTLMAVAEQYIPAAIMLAVAVLMVLLMTCWRSRIPFVCFSWRLAAMNAEFCCRLRRCFAW
jgi:hypothetical protein